MEKTQWNFRGILIDWVAGQGNRVWDFNLSNATWCTCSWLENGSRRSMAFHASYTLEGTDLENIESIKYMYLGVTITNDLRWNTLVFNVCTKANRTLGFLRWNLHSCCQEVKEVTYKGFVGLILEYGSSVWDSPGVVLQGKLESVQSHSWQEITNMKLQGSMTGILGQLKWESFKKRRKDNRLILLYKGLKVKASIPTDDIPKTRRGRNQHSKHFRPPLLIQMFINVASSSRLSEIGMSLDSSPILWSHLLKMQRIVLLNSLLVRARANFPNHRSWWMVVVSAFHQ